MEKSPKINRSERSFSPALSELSAAAMRALLMYEQKAGRFTEPDLLPQAERVVKVLDSFAPDAMPRHARDVAALQVVGNAVQTPNRPTRFHAAGDALLRYFTQPSDNRNQQTNGYVGTLLGDMPYVDQAANQFENRLTTEGHEILEGRDAMPPMVWQKLRVGANVKDLEYISNTTNVESQLARAALVNDYIATGGMDDDQELFRNVIRAESFYAPLLEVYGLHAFDMMVQSNARKVRAIKSGNERVLEHATKVLDQAKQISTDQVMQHILGRRPDDYMFKSSEKPLYGESIIFSTTSLDGLTDGAQDGELHARFKTVGKYTHKLLTGEHYNLEEDARPADVFGMLAVLPDERQLGEFFADVVSGVEKSCTVEFVTAPSKDRPIFIKGSPEFVEEVASHIPEHILDKYVQQESCPGKSPQEVYQVAKFTANLSIDGQKLPIEFQFQTKPDRFNARHGKLSHMNHNAGEGMASVVPGRPGALAAIHQMRYNIHSSGELVLPSTIPHGEEFKRAFSQAARL